MTDDELKATERYSRQILDSAIDYAILAMDLEGKITHWNEGARRMFGWSDAEVTGHRWDLILTHQDQAAGAAREAMRAALVSGTAHHERWHRRKSGELFWANGEISRIVDEGGATVGFVKVLRDRTKEHHTAQALRDAEARLRRAQEAGGVGVFSLDLITNVLSPTPEFCKIYGLPEVGDVSIEQIEALVVPDDRNTASNRESRKLGASPLDVEYRIRRADTGQKRYIARKGEFETDPNGIPIRFVGVVQDVTDRRRAQKELRDSHARFQALTQALPNHVWTAGSDGQLDWFNDRVYAFSGLKQDDLMGSGWTQMVHPDDLPTAAAKWLKAVAAGTTYEAEFRLIAADGTPRWHIARAVPTKDEDGAVVRWIGTNTDIEEQRETQAKLEALNKTLEERVAERTADRDRMWRLSTDIMLVADFEATITAVNPAWRTVFRWDEEELVGRSFMDLIHPDDLAATLAEVGKLSDGVTTFSFENRYRTKSGTYRTISWTAVPDDAFIHAVGRDVTQEREASLALRKTELALQQAQKMEAIGNLTGGVAHDFNNLLQVVAGNLQLLARDIAGNEKAEKRVTNALAGVERGAKLAAQLLAFGRRQALDPKVVNAGRLVRNMDEMLRRTIGEGIEVETVVAAGLWNTLIDPMQTENALLNLAINARDAMDGFGKLTIEVGNAVLDDVYARRNTDVVAGDYVVLSVTDTGAGMTPDIIEKVFEPFFTTKPEGKGTGLGLSMVYGFVKQTGGHVRIYSEIGLGTTIRIYLPRSQDDEEVTSIQNDGPAEGGYETILVAEDDEGVRATVVETLQGLGYRVLTAPDAGAAMSIIESGVPIDLLFTDVVMPGQLKSTDLARRAKERLPNIGVLFTSGYTENSIVHGGRLDAGVQLLSKPYAREALARKVRQVLDRNKNSIADQDVPPSPAPSRGNGAAGHDTSDESAKLSILVVEDEALIRAATADMIEDLGHEALEAGSGEKAILMLERQGVDVILTDLGLPGMTGEELCRTVRERWPALAIVFATGQDSAPDLADHSRTAMLNKPFGIEDLNAAIRKAIRDA
ncbi:PAS domain S-box protein [Rhizobium sp. Leaf384]|uniref:hybrid sensor histidine kinase/response regulator n=1 Tax=Rhizobium sp. Leaf384 TaxID=1736358 RepID=UPI000AAD075B|nr:PAS domain S-box protein [Rhizobium sp. Leaf384]